MAQLATRWSVDRLTTIGRAYDRARGVTPDLRLVIGWIAEHGCWVTRHVGNVWRANPRGTWTKEGVRHEVVLELARLGFLELLAPSGHKLDGGEPGHAKLLRIA